MASAKSELAVEATCSDQTPDSKESMGVAPPAPQPQVASSCIDITNKGSNAQAAGAEPDTGLPKVWQPPPPPPEHPQGEEIRRQVEYYFGDENLPTDKHLLSLCGNTQNLPVRLGEILGFKKMRQYKPRSQVVAALRKSPHLEISEDGKTIRRRIPLQGPTILDKLAEESDIEPEKRDEKPKQKKAPVLLGQHIIKSNKTPSGFEEYLTEAPITPQQYQENTEMYDPTRNAFTTRMEIAVQRFKQKRKMHQQYAAIFNKFMNFGGIKNGPRQFTGGLGADDLEKEDAGRIAQLTATHFAPDDGDDPNVWLVDFSAVAAAFLSSQFPVEFDYTDEDVKTAGRVLTTFYNYLMVHNVCPEYADQIMEARKIVQRAEEELPALIPISSNLPGPFNIACSSLFDGTYASTYVGDKDWAEGHADHETIVNDPSSMRPEHARIIFNTAIAAYGTDAQFSLLEEKGLDAITAHESVEVGLEVLTVEPISEATIDVYAAANEGLEAKAHLFPHGRLICKLWTPPHLPERDAPAHLIRGASELAILRRLETISYIVPEAALTHCFPGMKLEINSRRLSFGDDSNDSDDVTPCPSPPLLFIDTVRELYCSFYTYLPNEQLWKPHPTVKILDGKRKADLAAEEEAEMTRRVREAERAGQLESPEDVIDVIREVKGVPVRERGPSAPAPAHSPGDFTVVERVDEKGNVTVEETPFAALEEMYGLRKKKDGKSDVKKGEGKGQGQGQGGSQA